MISGSKQSYPRDTANMKQLHDEMDHLMSERDSNIGMRLFLLTRNSIGYCSCAPWITNTSMIGSSILIKWSTLTAPPRLRARDTVDFFPCPRLLIEFISDLETDNVYNASCFEQIHLQLWSRSESVLCEISRAVWETNQVLIFSIKNLKHLRIQGTLTTCSIAKESSNFLFCF